MYCVLWTYAVPPQLDEPAIRKQFAAVAENYLAVPGLIRKYFGFTEDAASVIGIYLWESKEAADAFYSPEWIVPLVAESVEGRVIGD